MKNMSKRTAVREWALHITAMRERLTINQAELARRMECSAMTISRWERGLLQPSAEHFIQLGNLGNKNEAWFFWEMAGIRPSKIVDALSNSQRKKSLEALPSPMEGNQHSQESEAQSKVVAVPILKAVLGTPGSLGDRRSSLRSITMLATLRVPAKWCPNPSYTSLIRVKGHSMEPAVRDGDLVAVDSFQTDRDKLNGQIVVSTSEQTGLCVSHLRRFDRLEVLEAENRNQDPVILSKTRKYRIVGKVLWSISGT